MKDKKAFTEFVMMKGYNTKLVEKISVNMSVKFIDAMDRMIYCNVRGLEAEAQRLFDSLTNYIDGLNHIEVVCNE